jgi:hypothetical protein
MNKKILAMFFTTLIFLTSCSNSEKKETTVTKRIDIYSSSESEVTEIQEEIVDYEVTYSNYKVFSHLNLDEYNKNDENSRNLDNIADYCNVIVEIENTGNVPLSLIDLDIGFDDKDGKNVISKNDTKEVYNRFTHSMIKVGDKGYYNFVFEVTDSMSFDEQLNVHLYAEKSKYERDFKALSIINSTIEKTEDSIKFYGELENISDVDIFGISDIAAIYSVLFDSENKPLAIISANVESDINIGTTGNFSGQYFSPSNSHIKLQVTNSFLVNYDDIHSHKEYAFIK